MTQYQNPHKKSTRTDLIPSLTGHLGGFLIIGFITTCTDISLLWILTEIGGIWYLGSAALSYCSSALFSYGLNKLFNFHNTSQAYVRQASAFLVIAASSLGLNLLIISAGVELFSLNYLTAKIFATGIAFFWNYLGQSTVTFRLWR